MLINLITLMEELNMLFTKCNDLATKAIEVAISIVVIAIAIKFLLSTFNIRSSNQIKTSIIESTNSTSLERLGLPSTKNPIKSICLNGVKYYITTPKLNGSTVAFLAPVFDKAGHVNTCD